MSAEKIQQLIRGIEELQTLEPPPPRGDDGAPRPDFKGFGWRDAQHEPGLRPTVGGNVPQSVRKAITAAFLKAQKLRRAGCRELATKWMWRGSDLMDLAIEAYGWDAVWRMDSEDNPASDIEKSNG